MTLENHGLLGFTVADFAEAMLGNTTQLKKLEVYSVDVSEAATITNAGLLKLSILSKHQIYTYHGTVTYTVDLSKLDENSIEMDEENKTITLYIPHTERGEITIPSDKIEFGDVEKGLLAWGQIKLSGENQAKIQTEATAKMEEKLENDSVGEDADRFAKMSVWEVYQPLVTSVSP